MNVIKVSMVMDIHVRGRTCSASCDGGIRHRYVFDSGDSNSDDRNETPGVFKQMSTMKSHIMKSK